MSLIEEIRSDILDQSTPLTSILRKAKVLAYKLKSDELKSWIDRELGGYGGKLNELPEYRQNQTHSMGDFINSFRMLQNHTIPVDQLPDQWAIDAARNAPLTGSVRALESLLESKEASFSNFWEEPLVTYFNRVCLGRADRCVRAWRVIGRGDVEHVLDSIRSRLLDFILEIEEANPGAVDVPALAKINPTVTSQIFRRCIMNNYEGPVQRFVGNKGSNIATGEARISSSSASYSTYADVTAGLESLSGRLDEVAAENREVVAAAFDLLLSAVEDLTVPKSRIVAAAETIASSSEALKRGLRDFSLGVSGSLAASALCEGVRFVVGGQ